MPPSVTVVDFGDRIKHNWKPERLDELISQLAGVDRLTEQAFLHLGAQVHASYTRAKGISEGIQETVALLQDEDEQNMLPRLQLLVERCSLWLDENQARSIEICDLLGLVDRQLEAVELPLLGLRKVIKTLHSLRVSTRIEASKAYGGGARVLADALNQIGLMIHQKIEEIGQLIENLVNLNRSALTAERGIRDCALRLARDEVSEARKGLTLVTGSRVETAELSSRLRDRSGQITRSFGEMIAALQFQDITRQRLEHIQTTLADLRRRLTDMSVETDIAADPEVTGLLGSICHLQHEQLNLSVEEFGEATANLKQNLQGMADSVVSLAGETLEFASSAEIGSDHHFTLVSAMLESISNRLEAIRTTHAEARESLGEVCEAIEGVSKLVDDVEYIGEEMQLLALNATISAAHARGNGAGLEVIADNIHELSLEASKQADLLARDCEQISGHAKQLTELEQQEQGDGRGADALLSESTELMASLSRNSESLDDVAGRIDHEAARLSSDVVSVVNGIDIKERFTAQIAPVQEQLEQLASWADPELSGGHLSLEDLLQQLQQRYTMSSERDVHRRFISRHAPKNVADEDDAVEEIDDDSGKGHDLGDNIVLF